MTPFSRNLSLLAMAYFACSLAHFAHNAEYIAFYPGMPSWITRETVYSVWLAVTGVGAMALVLAFFGLSALATPVLAAYGTLGLDGFAHYTLAICADHTLGANLTIWAEAGSGLLLAVAALWPARRRRQQHGPGRG